MKRIITLGTLVAMVVLMVFSGVAEAGIVGGSYNLPDDNSTATRSTTLHLVGGDTLTIDNGSTLTQTGEANGITLIGTFYGTDGKAALNISSGGIFEHTNPSGSTDGGNAFSLGNTGDITDQYGVVTVTGTGSKMTTLKNMRIGRSGFINPANTIASTLTIELGGMVMAEAIVYGNDASGKGNVRMGYGGILAIEGTKTLTQMATPGNGSGAFQYWNGSAWDDITNATAVTDYTLTYYSSSTIISDVDVNGYTVLEMMVPPPRRHGVNYQVE
jgi:T5SS/PEP-CTERM-associated repeat protein